MDSLDTEVLKQAREWVLAGHIVHLATVVKTWGSAPRQAGAMLAVRKDGRVVGSVSGGCIEDDLIARAQEGRLPLQPEWARYGVSQEEAARFGLPCGGTLELLLEFNPNAESLSQLIEFLEKGQLTQRSTHLKTGLVTLAATNAPSELQIDEAQLTNTFGPEYRMLLIGAGQMTEYLATMALFNGFAVTVCDPREEYRGAWSVSGVTVKHDMPDDLVLSFKPDRRSCVIALTHDPKLDDLALLAALDTEAFYIGAIGSRRNNVLRQQRMMEHFDQTETSLARLRGPIGIYSGSKTPAEIAVSIMAEVLAVKNGVPLPRDMDVAHAKNSHEGPAIDPSAPVCFTGR